MGNLQFFKPKPETFNRPKDSEDFSFPNLLHHNGGSYVDNYVTSFVDSISQKLLDIWEKK